MKLRLRWWRVMLALSCRTGTIETLAFGRRKMLRWRVMYVTLLLLRWLML